VTMVDIDIDDDLEVEVIPDDEEAVSEEAASPRPRRNLLIPGLIVTVLGLSLVLFFVYAFTFTNLKQARAQRQLLNVFTTPAGAVPLSGKLPAAGSPAAVLAIPAIGVHQVVVQGTTASETALGPGVMTQAARPGTIGNAVIVGRRSTSGAPFAKLSRLVKGDTITLASGLGRFRYEVIRIGVARPGQLDPASPVNRAQLTLMTEEAPLSTSSTYVVAKQLTAPGVAVKPTHKPSSADLGVAGDPSAMLPSVLLGLLYGLCMVATVIAYRRFRSHVWTVYVLSTPILLALALWWFENLYLILPATL